MRIDSVIIEVLAKAEVSGNTLRLTEQLDRKTYQQVSKVLSAIGGTAPRSATSSLTM